jgi:hypothetical protein
MDIKMTNLNDQISAQEAEIDRLEKQSKELYTDWTTGGGGACAFNDYCAMQPVLGAAYEELRELLQEATSFCDLSELE